MALDIEGVLRDALETEWINGNITEEAAERLPAHVAAVLREQIEQEVRRRLKRCGCAWCCATTPPEQRGETHKRTCQPLAAQVAPRWSSEGDYAEITPSHVTSTSEGEGA